MKQTTGKGKQWLMLPVVLLFCAHVAHKNRRWKCRQKSMNFRRTAKNLQLRRMLAAFSSRKEKKAELKTEHVVSQWLTVTEENGVVTVSYIPPDEKAVGGMDTDSHHLTLTLPEDWMPEKAALTAGTGPFYMDGAEAKDLFLHQGAGQMMLKHVTAENLELECGGDLAEGEHLQVVKNLTIHGGTGKISLTMPETAEDYDISGSFFTRNVTVNGKTFGAGSFCGTK